MNNDNRTANTPKHDWHRLSMPSHLDATDANVSAAKLFLMDRWRERAANLGRPEPTDLSRSCKFSSLFAQRVFGGTLRGHRDHQYVVLPDGRTLDLNVDAEDVRSMASPHHHDARWFGNTDHVRSMSSCLPAVQGWVERFIADHHETLVDSESTANNGNRNK